MKLHEITDKEDKAWMDKYRKVVEWMSANWSYNDISKFNPADILLTTDGEIRCLATIAVSSEDGALPFTFSEANATFALNKSKSGVAPTTMRGCPKTVKGDFYISGDITFEYSPRKVNGKYVCNEFTSLKGIEKHVDYIGTYLVIRNVDDGILSLILVKHLKEVKVNHLGKNLAELQAAVNIVNKHLGHGKAGVVAAQAEMLAYDKDGMDLERFAKL